MALSEAEFGKAIEGFATLVRRALLVSDDGDDGRLKGEWEDVEIVEKFGTRYLRMTKQLPLPLHSPPSHETDNLHHEDHHEIPIEDDDDPEALIPPTSIPNHPYPSQSQGQRVVYDTIHSPTYQVPVLYLTFVKADSNKSIPLPSPDEIYYIIVSESLKAPMRDVGVMGALSMTEHPITGMPAYFVHPCRTQEVMAPLLGVEDLKSNTGDPIKYLMLWLGVIGASVGLSVPVRVAKEFAEKRGEAMWDE